MTIREIVKILDGRVVVGDDKLDTEVKRGCGCDLMSDVLAFIERNTVLLTGLNNAQAVRTAEIAEVEVICFVRGKQPTEEMIELAREKDIALIATSLPLFEACGRLYSMGLAGVSMEHKIG
jgi:predicted transcriptional regulator